MFGSQNPMRTSTNTIYQHLLPLIVVQHCSTYLRSRPSAVLASLRFGPTRSIKGRISKSEEISLALLRIPDPGMVNVPINHFHATSNQESSELPPTNHFGLRAGSNKTSHESVEINDFKLRLELMAAF